MQTITMNIDDLESRVRRIFRNCGVRAETASAMARGITAGERDNCKSHGIYRVEGCLRVLKAGKVEPEAIPYIQPSEGPIIHVSASGGYSSPAYEISRSVLIERARQQGIAALVINVCLHFSALWYEIEDLSGEGLAALSMCPNHAVMAPTGGRAPLLGTNPFAFGWPRPGKEPYVFDFATTVVARVEIELHQREARYCRKVGPWILRDSPRLTQVPL